MTWHRLFGVLIVWVVVGFWMSVGASEDGEGPTRKAFITGYGAAVLIVGSITGIIWGFALLVDG